MNRTKLKIKLDKCSICGCFTLYNKDNHNNNNKFKPKQEKECYKCGKSWASGHICNQTISKNQDTTNELIMHK